MALSLTLGFSSQSCQNSNAPATPERPPERAPVEAYRQRLFSVIDQNGDHYLAPDEIIATARKCGLEEDLYFTGIVQVRVPNDNELSTASQQPYTGFRCKNFGHSNDQVARVICFPKGVIDACLGAPQ